MTWKIFFKIAACAGIFLFILAPIANAHEFKLNRSIGALLHMEPDDSPIVGQPAKLFFAFKDFDNVFDPASCECHVVIFRNEKIIYDGILHSDGDSAYGPNVLSLEFVFPEKGIYTLVVHGRDTEKKFQEFSLSYDIRLERDSAEEANTWRSLFLHGRHFGHLWFAVSAAVLMFGYAVQQAFMKK
jgi:hypothetical protein